ncbi:MAG: hypothetical protein GY827_10640 [Cytophagales bacterium]|nr:hypothetical protein [Cytophagales bacterium]
MGLNKKIVISATAAGLVALSGCNNMSQMVKMAEEQELKATPSPLELHGDSVIFTLSAKLPTKMLKKNRLYTLKASYDYGDTTDFDHVQFTETEFPNQDVEEPSLERRFSFYYSTPEMDEGELSLIGIASNLEKTKFKETPKYVVTQGLITTSRLAKNSYEVFYAEHGYDNSEELIPTRVKFNFDKGRHTLKNSEIEGADGKELVAFIASKNKTKTVTIIGSHSPEGLESINSKLAEKRAEVIKNFYSKKMKLYDYKGLADSIKFEVKAIFQNWDAFKKAVEANENLSSEDKTQINSIISGSGDFVEQEKQLAKLPCYKTLTSEIYPSLRTSKTEIWSVKPKKTDAEISILANSIAKGTISADTLSFKELMYSATLTPSLDDKEAIYTAATKQGQKWEANNNLGAVILEKALKAPKTQRKPLFEKALVQFEQANTKQETAIASHHIGVCKMFLGDREAAIEAFTKASELGSNNTELVKAISGGKGALEIRYGNYASAVSDLSNAGSDVDNALFNLGLTYLLQKKFSQAEQTLEGAIYVNKEDALAHYCLAIVGARTNRADMVALKLAQAIKLDPSLKEKAIKDLEFASFKETEAFKQAVK